MSQTSFFFSHTVKWFQVFLSNTNNSINNYHLFAHSLNDTEIGPCQVLPLQVWVDPGVMVLKGHSIFPKAPALLKPRHQIVYCVNIYDIRWGRDAFGVFHSPQLTGLKIRQWIKDYNQVEKYVDWFDRQVNLSWIMLCREAMKGYSILPRYPEI